MDILYCCQVGPPDSMPSNGHIVAYSLLQDVFTGLLPSNTSQYSTFTVTNFSHHPAKSRDASSTKGFILSASLVQDNAFEFTICLKFLSS
jgi:hypothetical protein